MTTNKEGNLQGRAKGWHGWMVKLGGLALGAVLCGALLAPPVAKADAGTPLTQLEYIRWLVQLADATSQFSANSTAADYVQWARDNGLNPKGGWNPSAPLTREVLAQTLVQFLGVKGPKSVAEFERALEREGIILPSSELVTRGGLVSVIDEFGFQSIVGKKAKKKKTVLCPPKTPGKPPKLKSHCSPPKEPPKPKTPKPKGTPKPPKPRK